MTEKEIEKTIKAFKEATIRAYETGFDGIEIHGANTYLLQQFFSPHSNIRTDEWGGSLENRLKFPLAVIEACMEAKMAINDPQFIIGYRFSPEENSEPGITLEDTDFLIDALCKTDLDYLHVSLGHYEETSMRDSENKELTLKRLINKIDHRKPFVGVGSVRTQEDANKILAYGVDLIALGRQALIDGKTADKWLKGQEAKNMYSTENHEKEVIPKVLHEIIISREGWIPVEKK